MTKKLYSLTKEHEAELKPWANRWIANAFSTKPMDDEERAICRTAVKGLYEAGGLKPPPDHRIVFVPSPFVLRFAGGFAAAIWWLRKNKKKGWDDLATDSATDSATRSATYLATDLATRSATYSATYLATDLATDLATRSATDLATRSATRSATYLATDLATDLATRSATRSATYSATDLATRSATRSATYLATDLATDLATRSATRSATDLATDRKYFWRFPTDMMLRLSVDLHVGKFGLMCAQFAYNMWQGGNQWSTWDSFLTFFRHVVKLKIDYSKYDHWEQLSLHSGPRIMHPEFCVISDRPRVLRVDVQNRPHCETGPYCEWSDGSGIFALNGVFVPEWLVMTPKEKLRAKDVMALSNAQERAEGIKKLGTARERLEIKVN